MGSALALLPIVVLALHIALDIADRHRHGYGIHDWLGVVCYVVLAIHFGFDLAGVRP